MSRFIAYIVEDEPDQASFTSGILISAGFEVRTFSNATAALTDLQGTADLIDLIVLDRRLPNLNGDVPRNETGDELLDAVDQLYPDALLVVFTGYADISHVQFAKRARGVVELQNKSVSIDRVEHFQKSESIEFEEHILRIVDILRAVENIELIGLDGATPRTKRLLKRVCQEYGGSSVSVRELSGGLTDAGVWRCIVSDMENTVVADLVVKRTGKPARVGGFQSILPAPLVAGTVASISGLCGGTRAAVLQVAGDDARSLLDLIVDDPSAAADIFDRLRDVLSALPQSQKKILPVSKVVTPFLSWDEISTLLVQEHLPVPDGGAFASTTVTPQHGDLHPANVLVITGAPVLIDFDSEDMASAVVDAVALCLGAIFHKASRLRESAWPTATNAAYFLKDGFLVDCPAPDYFAHCQEWIVDRSSSERELWSLVLAFSVRNLQYPDVQQHPRLKAFARSLCGLAIERMSS